MKKIIIAALMVLLVSTVLTAGEQTGADMNALGAKLGKITARYNKALMRVKNPRDLAKAINTYARDIEKISPEISKITAKYKHLEGVNEEDSGDSEDIDDKEFHGEIGKFMSNENMQKNFQTMAKYFSDPAVQKALMRLNMVMSRAFGEDEDE